MTDRDRSLAALCDAFVPGDGDLPSASQLGVPRLLRAEVTALERPALVAELDQLLDTIESPLLKDPATSVADPDGQVYGVRGLYITDASAFPNAAGVNPMLTVMALARRTAARMVAAS